MIVVVRKHINIRRLSTRKYMRCDEYGVATVSRIDKIIGLFCRI